MRHQTWRDQAAPVVASAIAEGRSLGLEGRALLRHVQAAYPFGPRQYHPYRVWLDEVRRQLGSRRRAQDQDHPMPLFPETP